MARSSRTETETDVVQDVQAGRGARAIAIAKHMKVSEQTIYGLVKRKEIEAVRIGRAIVIPNPDARKLLGLAPADQQVAA